MTLAAIDRPALDPMTVLVVDDTPTNRIITASVLKKSVKVLEAGNGPDAIALTRLHRPELILLDVMMPGMDGFEVARRLREDPETRDVPIIFVTAMTDHESHIRGLALGALDFLHKPINTDVLRVRVLNALEREQLRRESELYQRQLRDSLERLARHSSMLEAIFDHPGEAHLVLDEQLAIVKVNQLGQDWLQALGSRSVRKLDDLQLTTLEGQPISAQDFPRGPATFECRLGDDMPMALAAAVRPFTDQEGRSFRMLSLRDISDRMLAQQQLIEAQRAKLQIAADIQSQLLFGLPPQNLRGISLACHSEGSEGIAGDFYHFQRFNDHTVDLLTGDVMGKGIAAALIAAGVKSAYEQSLIKLISDQQFSGAPPSVQAIVNTMHADLMPELQRLGRFVTLTLLRVNRKTHCVTWVNAGHTPTLLGRAGSGQVLELLGDNLPLGVLPSERYVEHQTPMRDGDALLLFSDGLSESVNRQGEQFGMERIKALLKTGLLRAAYPTMLLNSLRSVVHDHTDFSVTRDDSTVVVLKFTPDDERCINPGSDCVERHLDLPRELGELTPLRRAIEASCDDMPEDYTQMLTLAVFEAATNIIRHTPEKLKRTHVTTVIRRCAQGVTVELIHEGQAFVPSGPASPDFSGNSFGGFGLYIIENAVDSVEYKAPMPGLASISLFKRFPGAGDASAA